MKRLIPVTIKLLQKIKPDLLTDLWPDMIQMIEARERKHLADLGKKYHVPIAEFRWRRQVFMDNGRDEVFDSGLLFADSPVRNYYNIVFSHANVKNLSDTGNFGTGYLSLKDTGGTIRGSAIMGYWGSSVTVDGDARSTIGILANAADDNMALVIGTGTTAWTFEDYVIETLTPNGSGSGPPIEFDYSQSELHAITNSTLTLKDTRIRDFNNNSGSSEDIEEVAEYMEIREAGSSRTIMIFRDLTGGDTVADTAQYRVTLESTLVFPA